MQRGVQQNDSLADSQREVEREEDHRADGRRRLALAEEDGEQEAQRHDAHAERQDPQKEEEDIAVDPDACMKRLVRNAYPPADVGWRCCRGGVGWGGTSVEDDEDAGRGDEHLRPHEDEPREVDHLCGGPRRKHTGQPSADANSRCCPELDAWTRADRGLEPHDLHGLLHAPLLVQHDRPHEPRDRENERQHEEEPCVVRHANMGHILAGCNSS